MIATEELMMIEIIKFYSSNSFLNQIDFKNYQYNEDKFITLIEQCKNAGMINKMIEKEQIINPSSKIRTFTNKLSTQYLAIQEWNTKLFLQINKLCRDMGIKLVVGGDYAMLRDYYGKGDYLFNELTLYLSEDLDLSNFSGKLKITKIIKNEEFFDNYYDKCIRDNFAPINLLYNEYENNLNQNSVLDYRAINLYLLYTYYIERIKNKRIVFTNMKPVDNYFTTT